MNLKSSMFKIGIVIALIIMLVPVIAAEDVDGSSVDAVDGSDDVVSEEVGEDSDDTVGADDAVGDDGSGDEDDNSDDETDDETGDETDDDESEDVDIAYGSSDSGSADLEVKVISTVTKAQAGDIVPFAIIVFNHGPDVAENVVVRYAFLSGDVYILAARGTQGIYDPVHGIWYVGDLEPGQYAILYLVGGVLSNDDILLVAMASSDTPDPNPNNNFALWYIDVGGEPQAAASETMPAAGNPILLALLALISIAGVTLRRKL